MSFNYHCFNTEHRDKCEFCNSKGDLILPTGDDEGKCHCPHNMNEELKCMGENPSGLKVGKMTSDQIKKEKKARSHKDFVKNVLPTISDPDVRKTHLKRIGKNS